MQHGNALVHPLASVLGCYQPGPHRKLALLQAISSPAASARCSMAAKALLKAASTLEPAVADVASPSLPQALQVPTQTVRTLGALMDPSGVIALGGHRGMGMNMKHVEQPGKLLTYRENTVESFLRAAEAGATFCEFDVQVTADGVPVLWHDDTVLWRSAEGGVASTAIADLSLAEFKRLLAASAAGEQPLLRSFYDSVGNFHAEPAEWRCAVDGRLPTLAEVFAHVPEHVGFDIEVKMTTPNSCVRTPQAEVDRMVNAILGAMMPYAGTSRRRMMFSSFDPDVCAALRLRQQRIPVLFLSDGVVWHADDRRNSVAAAVEVALQHQLQGVVLESGALRAQQGAAAAARRQGLHLMTFGVDNNDPMWVLQQHLQLGVSAAIVDCVPEVAAGLLAQLEPASATAAVW